MPELGKATYIVELNTAQVLKIDQADERITAATTHMDKQLQLFEGSVYHAAEATGEAAGEIEVAGDKIIAKSEEVGTVGSASWGKFAGAMKEASATAHKAMVLGGLALAYGVVKSGVETLKDNNAAALQLAAAIKTTGGVAGVTSKHAMQLAEHWEQVAGSSRAATNSMVGVLMSFTNIRDVGKGANAVFDRTVGVVENISAKLGKGLQPTAIAVGKALQDPVKYMSALARTGVTFTKVQIDLVKHLDATKGKLAAQKYVLGVLEARYGGAAKAAGQSFAGQLNRAKLALGEASAKMVTAFIPTFRILIHVLTVAAQFMSHHTKLVKDVVLAWLAWKAILIPIGMVIKMVNTLKELKIIMLDVKKVAPFMFGPWGVLILAVAAGLVILYLKVKWFRDAVNGAAAYIVKNWKKIGMIVLGLVAPLVYAYLKFKWFRDAVNSVIDFVLAHWKSIVVLILLAVAPFIAVTVEIIRHWTAVKTWFQQFATDFVQLWHHPLAAIGKLWTDLTKGIRGAFTGLWTDIKPAVGAVVNGMILAINLLIKALDSIPIPVLRFKTWHHLPYAEIGTTHLSVGSIAPVHWATSAPKPPENFQAAANLLREGRMGTDVPAKPEIDTGHATPPPGNGPDVAALRRAAKARAAAARRAAAAKAKARRLALQRQADLATIKMDESILAGPGPAKTTAQQEALLKHEMATYQATAKGLRKRIAAAGKDVHLKAQLLNQLVSARASINSTKKAMTALATQKADDLRSIALNKALIADTPGASEKSQRDAQAREMKTYTAEKQGILKRIRNAKGQIHLQASLYAQLRSVTDQINGLKLQHASQLKSDANAKLTIALDKALLENNKGATKRAQDKILKAEIAADVDAENSLKKQLKAKGLSLAAQATLYGKILALDNKILALRKKAGIGLSLDQKEMQSILNTQGTFFAQFAGNVFGQTAAGLTVGGPGTSQPSPGAGSTKHLTVNQHNHYAEPPKDRFKHAHDAHTAAVHGLEFGR